MDASRIPVIIGVGQINDRNPDADTALDSLGLMEAALRAAQEDVGVACLDKIDAISVVANLSFAELGDLSRPLADAFGASPSIAEQTELPSGDSPILLLNEAANRIGAGDIQLAAIVGGEALRTAARRATTRAPAAAAPNATRDRALVSASPLRRLHGLIAPIDVYPLYENAGRAANKQSLVEAQGESAKIWSDFSHVAAGNPGAWLRKALPPEAISTVSDDNRLLAYPYTKLMVANSSVNQGAGFIVASLAKARELGVPEDKFVYVGLGAAAHEPQDFLARDSYDHSSSMAVSIKRALELNGVDPAELDHVELYSCFPCVPKMARRILDWPLDKPASVVGGLTFGGGPIGNYMAHAVVDMVQKLRESGENGLLFANGGFATHNHTILLTKSQPKSAAFPQDFDFQDEADAARGPVPPINPDYRGPATLETYTVFYERDGTTKFGTVIARTPDGARILARVPASDVAGIAFLTNGEVEPVGTAGQSVTGDGEAAIWQSAAI